MRGHRPALCDLAVESEPSSPWQPGMEPIAGYPLIEPLGSGGFGEVWKCQAPGGLHKAIKFVSNSVESEDDDSAPAKQELQALEHIKSIRHPFLLSVERVEVVNGVLMIVMELADRNLADLLADYQRQEHKGIPRAELLEYMCEAAEALDLINFQHGLQHLDVKPQNLFLVSNHIKVADFGLVNSLTDRNEPTSEKNTPTPHPQPLSPEYRGEGRNWGVTPRYSSPEILQGQISPQSDQYSLAIVYQELLTSLLPFKGKNTRQLLLQHLQAEPDLSPLPPEDRPIVARALAKEPSQRFASCMDFVRALLMGPDSVPPQPANSGELRRTIRIQKKTACDQPRPANGRDTQSATASDQETPTAIPLCQPFSLAGYAYLNFLGQSPLGEMWTVAGPDGVSRIAHHLASFAVERAEQQAQALGKLQALSHPALVPFDVAELGPNRIILVSDISGTTLQDALTGWAKDAKDLIQRLGPLAETLDALAAETKLRHLALHPGNILFEEDKVRLRDIGLVQHLWQGSKGSRLPKTRWSAPELGAGKSSAASDQYSLARLYVDLRSAGLGHRSGGPARQAAKAATLDLSILPGAEAKVLIKALDYNPQ
ncbi:MAG: protein kinase, partial [Planctomycetaceae bacterium]|nr:protein kinase [Planctomycetaceae bacterium]